MAGREGASPSIDESIVIDRPVEDVFAFYADFRNLPDFLGDVTRVEAIDERTSRWTIQVPFGLELQWTVVVTDMRPNALIAYRTELAAASARWEIHFSEGCRSGTTLVHEMMSMRGGLLARIALAAVGKPPAMEVRANLKRLKERLETGRVTTMDYAVGGKFAR